MQTMKIILLGAGKLGKQLYRAFVCSPEIDFVQWYDRSAKTKVSADGIPITSSLADIQEADLYLLAVSDDAISEVAVKLPHTSFVAHTAGGVPINDIPQKRKGVFYPIQSFSNNQKIDFSTIPFGIEASIPEDQELLIQLVSFLGASYQLLSSSQRETLHLAAVLVNNFTNHLLTQAAALCTSQKLSFELLQPLLLETVQKQEKLTPLQAQTGPALRKDQKTINRHLKLIENKDLEKIYKTLTASIQKFYENEKL